MGCRNCFHNIYRVIEMGLTDQLLFVAKIFFLCYIGTMGPKIPSIISVVRTKQQYIMRNKKARVTLESRLQQLLLEYIKCFEEYCKILHHSTTKQDFLVLL